MHAFFLGGPVKLSISFRNASPSPADVTLIERQARSLADVVGETPRLRVVCEHDAAWATDVVARIAGCPIVARAKNNDMYEAVDGALDRLAHEAKRAHEKRERRQRRRLPLIRA